MIPVHAWQGAPAIPCDGVQNNCSDDNEVDAPDADNDGVSSGYDEME